MKPKLLYFSPGQKYKKIVVPNNHEPMIDRMDKWLEHYFVVETVSEDTDLAVEVQKHKPDMILFDGLLEGSSKLRINITSLDAYPEIPRAGFSRVDALSPTRGVSFEELMLKGAEVIFTLAEPIMGESMPDHRDSIIHIPWFFDPDLFKDYGLEKTIPIGMFGSFESPPYMYSWRAAIKHTLLDNLPALYFRHPGYNLVRQEGNPFVLFGKSYAKAINSCVIAPSHGGFTEIVVSKQMEIPACRTLLITQNSASLEAHGFKNGINCVFADPEDILNRIQILFNDRSKLDQITDQGFNFVHQNHTYKHRPQMIQWLELRKNLGKKERIVQPTLMGDLKIVQSSSSERTFHVFGSPIYRMLQEADRLIQVNDFTNADRLCNKLLSCCGYLSEPQLRLIIMELLSGSPHSALPKIQKPLEMRFSMGGIFPDPIEWSVLILILIAMNQPETLLEYLVQFTQVHRRELNICRWTAGIILQDKALEETAINALEDNLNHFSIHSFRNFTFKDMLIGIEGILEKQNLHHQVKLLKEAPSRKSIELYTK